MKRFILLAALAAQMFASACADAKVLLSFRSYSGSVLVGRYPHAFVVLDGTLDEGNAHVHENYGFSSSVGDLATLGGNVASEILVEKDSYVDKGNVHFTIPISDDQYRRIRSTVEEWRTVKYNFQSRNCLHFVAAIAQDAGIRADVPDRLKHKPVAWLDYVGKLNPGLNARSF